MFRMRGNKMKYNCQICKKECEDKNGTELNNRIWCDSCVENLWKKRNEHKPEKLICFKLQVLANALIEQQEDGQVSNETMKQLKELAEKTIK